MIQFVVKCFWGNESCSGVEVVPFLAENKEVLQVFLSNSDIDDFRIITMDEWLDGQKEITGD